MKRALQPVRCADLTPLVADGELVAMNVGPDNQLYAVLALKTLEDRTEPSAGAGTWKYMHDEPQAYRVVAFCDGDLTLDVHIAQERYSITDIQPLPNNELLLVCCRARYRGPNDFDKNGRVYSYTGELVREILLGDGIEDVQATSNGLIWTSFFDEGIYRSWGGDAPIGWTGLVAWDSHGNKVFEYERDAVLDAIDDCHALNVESDSSTWLYYYSQFPLVHVRNQRIESHWMIPSIGSDSFAVSRGFALFHGGSIERDYYRLYELGRSGSVKEVAALVLTDENGEPLVAKSAVGRSDALYVVHGQCIYRCDIQMAVAT